jgi:hypothetical protein
MKTNFLENRNCGEQIKAYGEGKIRKSNQNEKG